MGILQDFANAQAVNEALKKGVQGYDKAVKNETDILSINNDLGGHTVGADVPENAKFTDTIYNDTAIKYDISKNKVDISTLGDRVTALENSADSEPVPLYTNLLPTATDTDRVTIYEGKGYKTETRLSSSGSPTDATGKAVCASGFITAKEGDILRIKGISFVTGVSLYVIAYDSNNVVVKYNTLSGDAELGFIDKNYQKYADGILEITLSGEYFSTGFNAIRFSGGDINESTIVTINEEIVEGTSNGPSTDENVKLELIRNWDAPIYDANIPVFELTTEKAAVDSSERTPTAIYAKYDELMTKYPRYITKTNLGLCSDGVTPVYRYDFREPEPHHSDGFTWSETKIKAILTSGIHFEWAGIYGLYYALEEITENPDLYALRRNTHFIVVPVSNPYCTFAENYNETMGVLNANGVQIHRNFEVGFIYPDESGYVEAGNRNHGGVAPLSEVETQYLDNIMKNNPDSALLLSCHNYGAGEGQWGIDFIWTSSATAYMCNMGYRLADKMTVSWLNNYGTDLEAGIADYKTENLEDGDTRLGMAHISNTDGTETRQATKYGIQGVNVEIQNAFTVHGTKANPEPSMSSFTMSRGAETYINFLLTALGCYDYKDKALYSK